VSVTAVQLATAYTGLANDGRVAKPTMLRRNEMPATREIMSVRTAHQIREMLGLAVSQQGTGSAAKVRYYNVAGETGTAHKLVGGGYRNDQYISSFAGFAPASHPRLVMVVVIDEPSGGAYYGGLVAAPVFARVMSGALRLLDVPPDNADEESSPIARSMTL
jgi:cell division protein FtsI (penicillin-binding protein 3)